MEAISRLSLLKHLRIVHHPFYAALLHVTTVAPRTSLTFPKLETLDFGCKDCTAQECGMYHLLGFKWPSLKTWSYSSLPYTSDNLMMLADSMPKLDRLQMVHDVALREEMVHFLTAYSRVWRVLILRGLPNVWEPEHIRLLREAFPYSRIHLHNYYRCTLVHGSDIRHVPDDEVRCPYLE
jgi:hypothetical protein